MEMSTAYIMRSRPFVLPDHLSPAFDFEHDCGNAHIRSGRPRRLLQRFLELRNLPADRIAAIVARFDDPAIVAVIPAPNLRAALLMLSDWDPYQATIDAILDGKNESGHPFETVDFRALEFGAAIATLQVAYQTGHPRLLISDRYRNETPQQLIPVLVHESMHDGVDNSFEEEIIAGLLDSLTYAEVISIDPEAANTGTELAAYNNVQLFALMNSIGRRGAGYVGVVTSLDGDAYIGPVWKRSMPIASAPVSPATPGTSSFRAEAATAARCWKRCSAASPKAPRWSRLSRFSEEAIAVIDQGIGLDADAAKSPRARRRPRALARHRESTMTGSPAISIRPSTCFPARPFLPDDLSLFDLRAMHPTLDPLDAEFARAALRESLIGAGVDSALVSLALAQFDDPAERALVPDPTLRAALLMLHRDPRWDSLLASALDGANEAGSAVRIAFRDLPIAVPAIWEAAEPDGAPAVWINSMLRGERPELLATAIAEGLLLESADECAAHAVIAAALSSILWTDFVVADRSLTAGSTWGTITRNRDLLALLNSQPFDPGTPDGTSFGLRLATGPDGDVLPGLTIRRCLIRRLHLVFASGIHNDNVASRALRHPRSPSSCSAADLTEPTLVTTIQIDDDLLASVDLGFAQLLPAQTGVDAAAAFGLRLSSSQT